MAPAKSIIGTSGAGFSLEARVAGLYLAALLTQSSGPGDDAARAIERLEFQRTDAAAGFDDLHLHHRLATGGAAKVLLQIKRTLTGSRSEEAFRRPVGDAARLVDGSDRDHCTFRIVASQSALAPRDVDRAGQAARLSSDGADFWSRWHAAGASSDSERAYTSAVAWVIEKDLGRPDADLAWRVISRLELCVLDVDQTGSQTIARAVDHLQGALVSGGRAEALQLFETLCQFAEVAAKVAGGVDRARLLSELVPRYRMIAAPSARACIERIAAEANAALASIRDDIAGVRLDREDLFNSMAAAMRKARGVRLGGEAGTGKSAVLRRIAEDQRAAGAGLLVLKHDRLTGANWPAHAQLLQIRTPLARLVEELSAGGSGLLVLDGFDRIMEAGFGSLVLEICDAISNSAAASRWRCVVASRDAAGPAPSLDMPLLEELRPWAVGAPSPQDLAQIAQAFPHLAPLMARRGYAELNRNLFFIDQMARNPSEAGASSELDLLRAWARRGLTETPRHPSRDSTLRLLGEQRLARPYAPLQKVGEDEALARLASERTVIIPAYRDVVTFAHDIYEDWAVARALDARRDEIPAILKAAGQPLAWMRAIRLVAETAFEADGAAGWLAFHDLLRRDDGLDPLWRRLTLTALLHSPRAASALDTLEPILIEDGGRLMTDLAETLLSLEVRPHPRILSAPDFDHLEPAERRRLAQDAAAPRLTPWFAFLTWSADRWSGWPTRLVPVLARVTLTWLRLPGRPQTPTGRIVEQCVAWLRDLDAIHAMRDWEERSRLLEEMGARRSGSADPGRGPLRLAIANGAGDAADAVDAYLGDLIAGGSAGSEFVETPGVIPAVLPRRFVDLVISTMVLTCAPDEPLPYSIERSDGIRELGCFFPASPVRAGWDLLFAAEEDQALRLLSALSSSAAAIWRRRQAGRGLTARPVSLVLEGVDIELWGDEHVYKWVSGLLGPRLLGCLFLAADNWLADQVAAGRAFGELCAKLLGSSHLVTSAALCLAAAIDRPEAPGTLRAALPLISQPRLWGYDLRLSLDDRNGIAFRIGWRPGDDHAFRAALEVRERRVRRHPLVEGLIVPLHLAGDDALKDTFRESVGGWRIEDLADFDEQLDDEGARAELDRELESWRAKSDPANWRIDQGPREGSFSISYTPPDTLGERTTEIRGRQEDLAECRQLLDWAFGHVERGVSRGGQTFLEALPIAKAMDASDLFEHALDFDPAFSIRSRGIAAVAAAVATHGEPELVETEMRWLVSVIRRAAAIDHRSSPFHFEETALSDDAAASAARGSGALSMRGLADRDMMAKWLGLVASPFRDIAAAALEPASAFAARRPAACSAAIAVSAESMLYAWQTFDRDFEQNMFTSRADRCRLAIDRALSAIERDETSVPARPLPVTEPFIAGDAANPCAGDPLFQFDTYRASAVWSALAIEDICESADLRGVLVDYASDALRWYASFIEFQDSRRGFGADRRMDWEATLGGMAGKLAYLVPADEAIGRLVASAASIGGSEARNDVLSHFLNAFGGALVDSDDPINAGFEAVWRSASQPMFDDAEREGTRHDPDEMPLAAAAFVCFGMPSFPPNWPRARGLIDLIQEWVVKCARFPFAASVVRQLVAQCTFAFAPFPGLDWLEIILDAHRSTDAAHWQSAMGRAAGDILELTWTASDKGARRAHVVRYRAAAALLADRSVSSAAGLLPQIAIVQAEP